MPDIEVTLDEIKDTTIKTQKDLDNLMRDWSKPDYKAAAKSAAAGFPSSGAGFLDTVIKGITSKSIIGGLITGGAAGGVIALIDVIKGLTRQSKILATMEENVSKTMGLLLDLVLLPFLPLLVFGLLFLYTAVMNLAKIWNDWVAKTGIGSAAEKVINPPEGSTALSRTLDFLALINELAKAWLDGMTRLIIGTALFFGELFTNILKFGIELIVNIAQKLGEAWLKFQEWIVQKVRDLIVVLSEAWAKVATGLDTNLITPIKNALNVLRDGFIAMINWVVDRINSVLPPGFKINNISTAPTPAAPSTGWSSGGADRTPMQVTNNFNGLTPDQLPETILNTLRQAGDRLAAGFQ